MSDFKEFYEMPDDELIEIIANNFSKSDVSFCKEILSYRRYKQTQKLNKMSALIAILMMIIAGTQTLLTVSNIFF